VRVRHHDQIVRLELSSAKCAGLGDDLFERITIFFKSLGFKYVTLDLEGYRTGSMNPVI